jgi:hypothetical protein
MCVSGIITDMYVWLAGLTVLIVGFTILGFNTFFTHTVRESAAATSTIQYDLEMASGEPTNLAPANLKDSFRKIIAPYPGGHSIPIEIFEQNYATIGPEAMVEVLDERPLCHPEGHNLGRVIYEHTKDLTTATLLCKNSCSAGCIHGVLLGLIASQIKNLPANADPGVAELTPALKNKLAHMCERSEITKYTGEGNCYHAMGHVLDVLADENIPEALKLCQIYAPKGSGAVYYCATGVYMQFALNMGENDWKSSGSILYPCNTGDYPAACYRYVIDDIEKRMGSKYTGPQSIATMCESLKEPDRSGCFHGLGFALYRLVLHDPKNLNIVCGMGTDADKRMCIEGTLGMAFVVEPDLKNTVCDTYTAGGKKLCKESRVGNFSMQRDFSRYALLRN